MNTNHLIIGLGGTGGKIIRALRKTVYQEFRRDKPEGVNIRYLYVDSSAEMMSLNDPSWKILGTSVQLGEDSKLLIRGADLAPILDNISKHPNVKPWIGERAHWADILNGIVGDAVGGQKRRMGRFLFANQAKRFCELVTNHVRELQTGSQSEVTFHFVCGLAGGTGSGSLVDAIAQTRKLFPDPVSYRILVYTFLPEEHPQSNWNTGNYHANGYAALQDLNALSVGSFLPHDVAADGKRIVPLMTPFNGCYLFLNRNENGLSVDTNVDLPNVVADFLYQKIVTVRQVDWTSLARAENAENGDGNPETLAGSKIGVRSKRFLAFGVKRIAIPEEEITEYLLYSFAHQAALQIQYNNWSDGQGYLPEPRKKSEGEYLKHLKRWLLSDEHLTLSEGIYESDTTVSRWQPVAQYWSTAIPAFRDSVEREEPGTRLDKLIAKVEQRFAEGYRGQGVKAFYKGMTDARKERAREIRRRLELELFADCKSGSRSLQETGAVVADVISYLRKWLESADDQLRKYQQREEEAHRTLVDQQAEWTKMGPIARMTGKPGQIVTAAAMLLQEYYNYRTYVEGYDFAKRFVPEILEEMVDLKTSLDKASSMVSEGITRFVEAINSRCTDDTKAHDLRQQVIRFYDPEQVKNVARRLVKDDKEQLNQTQQVRNALAEKLGDRLDFKTFNDRINKTIFIDTLEKQCLENVKISHNTILKSTRDRLLGVSILEKLRERYSDPQDLRTFVDRIVKAAGNYLTFNQREKDQSDSGINKTAQMCVTSFTVIIPKAPDEGTFVRELREAFKSCTQVPIDFVEKEGSKNEITLVSITNLFPLRVVEQARYLRDRYYERIATGGPRTRLELHTEGDGSTFPELFLMSDSELVDAAIPYLLIGKGIGIISIKNGPLGGPELLVTKGQGFERQELFLGKNVGTALDSITPEIFEILRHDVSETLQNGAYGEPARREQLEQAMYSDVQSLKDEVSSGVMKRLMEGGKVALRILRGQV